MCDRRLGLCARNSCALWFRLAFVSHVVDAAKGEIGMGGIGDVCSESFDRKWFLGVIHLELDWSEWNGHVYFDLNNCTTNPFYARVGEVIMKTQTIEYPAQRALLEGSRSGTSDVYAVSV